MQRLLVVLAACALASLFAIPALAAGGGGGGDMGGASTGGGSSGVEAKVAARRFDRAKKHFEEAKALEAKLETASPDDREDLEDDIKDHYEDAVDDLEYVVRKQPKSYAARSELGFAQRKLGKFEDSLESYDKALELRPSYTPAIEYRGEAYLELGRLTDAQVAWDKLSKLDGELADQLLGKMQKWLARQQAGGPGAAKVDADALAEFQRWLAEKKVSDLPPGFVRSTASNW